MPTSIRIIAPADQIRQPWKNGGGVSAIIAGARIPGVGAAGWEGVVWQLSRTAIVAPGRFSDLSGFDRLQAVVAGEGLFLDGPGGTIDLSRPLTVAAYDGGTPLESRLTCGPVEVVNLIARRSAAAIALTPLRAGEAVRAGAGAHVLYAAAGDASAAISGSRFAIAHDHAAAFEGPADVACGRGALLLASAAPRGTA